MLLEPICSVQTFPSLAVPQPLPTVLPENVSWAIRVPAAIGEFGVGEGVLVGLGVPVVVGVGVGVEEGVLVALGVPVAVGVRVGVEEGVLVGLGVLVGVGVRVGGFFLSEPSFVMVVKWKNAACVWEGRFVKGTKLRNDTARPSCWSAVPSCAILSVLPSRLRLRWHSVSPST
jgi:hypothetical protein